MEESLLGAYNFRELVHDPGGGEHCSRQVGMALEHCLQADSLRSNPEAEGELPGKDMGL